MTIPGRIDELERQRDDLLAALERAQSALALQAWRDSADPEILREWRKLEAYIRATIARARGEA